MPRSWFLTAQEEQAIIVHYGYGYSMAQIGAMWKISPSTVGKILKRHGIQARSTGGGKRRSVEDDIIIGERFLAGERLEDIGQAYGISKSMVSHLLKKQGLSKEYYSLDLDAFTCITDSVAYWLGFIFADGSIDKYSLRIELQKSDSPHLQTFLDFLQSDSPIFFHIRRNRWRNGHVSHMAYVRIHSKQFVDTLRSLGVTENKGSTAVAPSGFKLSSAFWRGVVDGDGYLGLHRMNSRTAVYYPALGVCGSLAMMQQCLDWTKTIVPESKIKIRQQGVLYRIDYRGLKAFKLIATLYSNTSLALPRKAQLAQEIMSEFGERYEEKAGVCGL